MRSRLSTRSAILLAGACSLALVASAIYAPRLLPQPQGAPPAAKSLAPLSSATADRIVYHAPAPSDWEAQDRETRLENCVWLDVHIELEAGVRSRAAIRRFAQGCASPGIIGADNTDTAIDFTSDPAGVDRLTDSWIDTLTEGD